MFRVKLCIVGRMLKLQNSLGAECRGLGSNIRAGTRDFVLLVPAKSDLTVLVVGKDGRPSNTISFANAHA